MTSFRAFTLFTVVLFLGSAMLTLGCVSTTLQLSGNHPARPNADAGIAADPAGILRPDAALYAATEEVVQLQQPNGTAENPYVGHGTIREVQDGVLVIQHDAIPGFMGAMTMPYPVGREVDVRTLTSGDQVLFDIEILDSGGYQILAVEELEGDAAAPGAGDHNHVDEPTSPEQVPPELQGDENHNPNSPDRSTAPFALSEEDR